MYRLWLPGLYGLYGPRCPLSPKRRINLISLSLSIVQNGNVHSKINHDDVIKWKHFLCNWPSVRGIHRPPVNSPHKGQWRRAFMFSLICAWINDWINNCEAGDLRRHRTYYDVTVMLGYHFKISQNLYHSQTARCLLMPLDFMYI